MNAHEKLWVVGVTRHYRASGPLRGGRRVRQPRVRRVQTIKRIGCLPKGASRAGMACLFPELQGISVPMVKKLAQHVKNKDV